MQVRPDRRKAMRGALVALAACLVGVSLQARAVERVPDNDASDSGLRLISPGVVIGAFVGVSMLFGLLLYVVPSRAIAASRRSIEATMRERAIALQEEDRRRIARELHDGAGQALTAARLQLMALKRSGVDAASIDPIMRCIDEAMEEVRRSTTSLSPPVLADVGFGAALIRHCEAFSMGSRLPVRCEIPDDLRLLPASVEIACFRIVQEGLHNAARHSGASEAWVRLSADDELRLEIGDDGAGLVGEDEGFGIGSIRERAALLGGTVKVVRGAGPGSRFVVTVPLDRRDA